jgi:hypothetical protein
MDTRTKAVSHVFTAQSERNKESAADNRRRLASDARSQAPLELAKLAVTIGCEEKAAWLYTYAASLAENMGLEAVVTWVLRTHETGPNDTYSGRDNDMRRSIADAERQVLAHIAGMCSLALKADN